MVQGIELSNKQTEENEDNNGDDDMTQEEIEEFIQREIKAASEGNNANINSVYTPQVGMEFRNRDDAHHFFFFYSSLAGFVPVITNVSRTTAKGKNKTVEQLEAQIQLDVGNKKGRKRTTNVQVKTDCPVVMVVRDFGGIWKVIRLDLDHNHPLVPDDITTLLSGHKYMTDMEKAMIRTLDQNNIETRKVISVLSYLRGGMKALPYKKKDVSNYRTKIHGEVTRADMNQVMGYFRKRKDDDPTFFYKFELDEDKRLKNLFWCDESAVKYYAKYGDCISFDTTHMTNRYNLPFAPFVGITGHTQTCIFGCAFMHDQTEETFVWVFEAFLEAMGGKHPKTIITDQDQAMRAAIKRVFPNTIHRNCFFHIKSKCYGKNGKVFATTKGLMEEFEDVVNNCITTAEFEILWPKMIADYGLESNKYFSRMWEIRDRFIPVYYKNDFFPFIQTTTRNPTYTMMSFMREHQRIVDTINIVESREDTYSRQKHRKESEEEAQDMYNRNIFKKFQIQLQGTSKQFEVWPRMNQIHNVHRLRKYLVTTELTEGQEEFNCICAKFSEDGILCSHILKVMVEKELNSIPEKYIIDRWRKKEKKLNPQPVANLRISNSSLLRFNAISRETAVVNSKGARTEETMQYVLSEIRRIDLCLNEMLANDEIGASAKNQRFDGASTSSTMQQTLNHEEVCDPVRLKQTGRPSKPKRLKPMIEQIRQNIAKKKKSAKLNEKTGSPSKPKKKIKRSTAEGQHAPAP
ncbi:hypothetical protein BS78_05G189600 [Paspalum vaginatum]|nr:hypothetical protein BS78_05G189600 [Paspalum vaginatum]